jgi:NAD(P)-dependent dehydrogenase (short-subunit alcohol dehydrogenase family)
MASWLVTGANRGIGLALFRLLQARGDSVIAVCRTPSAELQALGVRIEAGIELTNSASLDNLATRLGLMRSNHIAAVAVAVVTNGVVARAQGYGQGVHSDHRLPTRFRDQAAHRDLDHGLIGQGRLTTNTLVRSVLTDEPATWQGITIAPLLSHTAGVTDSLNRDYGFGWSINALPGGGRPVHHNGGGFGYATAIYRWLDAVDGGETIIVLTNKQAGKHGWQPGPDAVAQQVYAHRGW